MTLMIELSDNKEAALKAKANALGLSAQQYAQQVIDRDLVESVQQPIPAMFREIWSGMPDDVRAKIPKDGSIQ